MSSSGVKLRNTKFLSRISNLNQIYLDLPTLKYDAICKWPLRGLFIKPWSEAERFTYVERLSTPIKEIF